VKTRYLLTALLLAAVVGCAGEFESGDRVLVSKFFYDSGLKNPERFDVVVFKYPEKPTREHTPTNYIKRLLGLAGETIAIFFGGLYRYHPDSRPEGKEKLSYPLEEGASPLDLWKHRFMHTDDENAISFFKSGRFEPIRKPPSALWAMRRIVYDNDFPAADLKGVLPPRWQGIDDAWSTDEQRNGFRHQGRANANAKVDWLRYRHILRPYDWPQVPSKKRAGAEPDPDLAAKIAEIKGRKHEPQLITDFEAYNRYELEGDRRDPTPNWVGSLMIDCNVTVEKAEGELWLELSRSSERYRAKFDLATGKCSLFWVKKIGGDDLPPAQWVEEMASGLDDHLLEKGADVPIAEAATRVSKPGTYHLVFADADDRLTLWVDRDLPFNPGVNLNLPQAEMMERLKHRGPTPNDLQPASIGFKGTGAVKVNNLKLWRDTYYTVNVPPDGSDAPGPPTRPSFWNEPQNWEHPSRWGREEWTSLNGLKPRTMYVQPGHYLCLGDNSPESSDGRTWGLVPERLLLGRAMLVYYPFNRVQVIK
jgi:signal peptidase I